MRKIRIFSFAVITILYNAFSDVEKKFCFFTHEAIAIIQPDADGSLFTIEKDAGIVIIPPEIVNGVYCLLSSIVWNVQ